MFNGMPTYSDAQLQIYSIWDIYSSLWLYYHTLTAALRISHPGTN